MTAAKYNSIFFSMFLVNKAVESVMWSVSFKEKALFFGLVAVCHQSSGNSFILRIFHLVFFHIIFAHWRFPSMRFITSPPPV
jgi:hypothetical protein